MDTQLAFKRNDKNLFSTVFTPPFDLVKSMDQHTSIDDDDVSPSLPFLVAGFPWVARLFRCCGRCGRRRAWVLRALICRSRASSVRPVPPVCRARATSRIDALLELLDLMTQKSSAECARHCELPGADCWTLDGGHGERLGTKDRQTGPCQPCRGESKRAAG